MKTSIITKHKKLPSFIKSHRIFSKITEIDKIFPSIGLDNCSVLANRYSKQSVKIWLLKIFSSNTHYFQSVSSLQTIRKAISSCSEADFVKNGKLVIPAKIKTIIGTSYQNALIKCKFTDSYTRKYYYRNSYYRSLFKLPTLKKNIKVTFSSDGQDGMWDIATMSMRGISSCQSWNGSYKRNLVGSIVDPYCGIIYLTDGVKTLKGEKMILRALVRYVVHTKTHKPALLVESIYGNANVPRTIFDNYLKIKTKNKLPIIHSPRGYSIPNSAPVAELSSCGKYDDASDSCRSYRDSNIGYARSYSTFKNKI